MDPAGFFLDHFKPYFGIIPVLEQLFNLPKKASFLLKSLSIIQQVPPPPSSKKIEFVEFDNTQPTLRLLSSWEFSHIPPFWRHHLMNFPSPKMGYLIFLEGHQISHPFPRKGEFFCAECCLADIFLSWRSDRGLDTHCKDFLSKVGWV